MQCAQAATQSQGKVVKFQLAIYYNVNFLSCDKASAVTRVFRFGFGDRQRILKDRNLSEHEHLHCNILPE